MYHDTEYVYSTSASSTSVTLTAETVPWLFATVTLIPMTWFSLYQISKWRCLYNHNSTDCPLLGWSGVEYPTNPHSFKSSNMPTHGHT